jgi:tryptophan-rich sensory protein
MRQLRQHPLVTAIVTCLATAVLGTLLVGDGLETWYPNLEKPAFLIPLWAFYIVGVLYYLLFGTVIFRILTQVEPIAIQRRLLSLTISIMLLNELWNFALFGWQSTLAGFLGTVLFVIPLLVLTFQLIRRERLSGILLVIYCGWVLYDLVWTYALWQLNL